LRMQQITMRDEAELSALEKQKRERQRDLERFEEKYGRYLTKEGFPIGSWVVRHESWLDTQKGNKGAMKWTGPYIIHDRRDDVVYQLRELDGTVMRGWVNRDRLKIFYYREDHQTL
ncbi:hypothetical protein BDN72DRAFT_742688, partial [Pluteus cervinus]